MDLSTDLAVDLVKAITPVVDSQTKSETILYGTVKSIDKGVFVQIDGSDLITPVVTTSVVKTNERVTLTIKNHTAIVTGNLTTPSAPNDKVEEIEGKVGEYDEILADTITSKELDVERARINELIAKNVIIEGGLTANKADIAELKAGNVTITGNLTAAKAEIEKLKAGNVTITGDLTAAKAEIETLKAKSITTEFLESNYAKIDLANIKAGCITTAMIGEGVIESANIADGSITDAKIVGLTANKITAGTLDATEIEVINLNCANLTVGTINGQQISSGAIDWDKLSNGVSNDIIQAGEDASQALQDALNAMNKAEGAQNTADGKNTVIYAVAQPSVTGRKINDIWFDSDDGYKMYFFNGTTWADAQYGTNAIKDAAITNAKIATLDAGKITTGYLSADRIAANSIIADKIAANAVTTANLQADSVNSDKIAANAILAEHIKAGVITGDKLVASTITGAKIAAKTITATNIAANTITSAEINASSIKAVILTADSITGNMIAADALKSRNYVAGSTGSFLNLSNGSFDSKYLKWSSTGDITISSGLVGNWTITEDGFSTVDLDLVMTINSKEKVIKVSSITSYNHMSIDGFSSENINTGAISILNYDGLILSIGQSSKTTIEPGVSIFTLDGTTTDIRGNKITTGNITVNTLNITSTLTCDNIMSNGSLTVQSINSAGDISCNDLTASGAIHSTGWIYTHGSNGWRSNDYGGGWYCSDNTYVRSLNNRSIYTTGGITAHGVSSVNEYRFASGWIGFYNGGADAQNNANRRGIIGDFNSADMYIQWEASPKIIFKAQGNTLNYFYETTGAKRTIWQPGVDSGAYIGRSGNKWNTGFFTNTISASDLKQKSIVKRDMKAKQFIMSLNPISYRRTGNGDTGIRVHMGFGAQHVAETIKKIGYDDLTIVQASIIEGDNEFPYHGEDIDDKKLSWGLNYIEFIPPMVSVLQSHETDLMMIKKELNELKSKLNSLFYEK